MKSFPIEIPGHIIEDSATLGELLARRYSNGANAPVFTDGNFARFIADTSGILNKKRISSHDIALQIRYSALQVLWGAWAFGRIYRPIIIESGTIPRHNDDDSSVPGVLGNSIKRVNDAVTLIVPLYGFENGADIFHSESDSINITGNGRELIIHDQVRDHWVDSGGSTAGERRLWWSGLIKRSLAEKKGFT